VSEVAIIDSGGANIASLLIAFERLQTKAILTSDADVIKNAGRVLLPGVGAAKDAMARLIDLKLVDVIRDLKQPVLGICLGMQLLCEASEEEDVECLGVIPGTAKKLPPKPDHPVPNMGWCSTQFTAEHRAIRGIDDGSYFYYLHSYALPVSGNTLATARHAEDFSAIVSHENFVAAQFHPERSSTAGARLLLNFIGTQS
jgi:glutamine amidotransferase